MIKSEKSCNGWHKRKSPRHWCYPMRGQYRDNICFAALLQVQAIAVLGHVAEAYLAVFKFLSGDKGWLR